MPETGKPPMTAGVPAILQEKSKQMLAGCVCVCKGEGVEERRKVGDRENSHHEMKAKDADSLHATGRILRQLAQP
jgi:hypothetical protein